MCQVQILCYSSWSWADSKSFRLLQVNLKMRVRISYSSQGSAFQDTIQIDAFPGLSAAGHWRRPFSPTGLWRQCVDESADIALTDRRFSFPAVSPSTLQSKLLFSWIPDFVGVFYGWRTLFCHRKSQPRTLTQFLTPLDSNYKCDWWRKLWNMRALHGKYCFSFHFIFAMTSVENSYHSGF